MRLSFVCVLPVVLAGSLLAAEPQVIELTIEPRAIESPALKYRLLPGEAELKDGNAAPILLRLPWEQMPWMTQVYPKLHEWDDRPLDAPEWASSGGVLPERFYGEMKRAAFRRDADWGYPLGETQSPYLILLPDVQGLRGFLIHGLNARIRYHLGRGELDQAREGILVGLANSRHIARTPFYVNQLVALAIERRMFERALELIGQPESPNLYWALSSLPDSLIDLDRAASLESSVFEMTLPAVHDLDRPRQPNEWRKMAQQLVEVLEQLEEIPPRKAPAADAPLAEQLLDRLNSALPTRPLKFVDAARQELPGLLNLTEKKVAAMSDDEVVVRWYVHYRLSQDKLGAAAMALPPREAWPLLVQLRRERLALLEKTGGTRAEFISPTMVYVGEWSLRQRIAALRIVEAVRNHLAAHEGAYPAKLDDLGVPVPLDPLSDQPFAWSMDGTSAVLATPPLPAAAAELGDAAERLQGFEIRLKVR